MKTIAGSICAPRGFRAAAVFCDIKRLGTGKGSEKQKKGDLGLIVSDTPAAVAGLFTSNRVAAAPVKLSAKHAARDFARAIVVNSGNANACTGARGMRDARAMAQLTAGAVASARDKLDVLKPSSFLRSSDSIRTHDVLVCSTGRIGLPMPMDNVRRGIDSAARQLGNDAHAVAEAIMTSDTRTKEIAVEFELGGGHARIGGICKGAGMIHPKMTVLHATMLAFITTDAAIAPQALKRALAIAVEQSFNRISVDGDTSTNDSVIALANGMAGNRIIERSAATQLDRFNRSSSLPATGAAQFQAALNFVTLELAKMIVRDGEGVSRFITLHVRGARTSADAERVARAVANSTLVKTSWCGGDPNWGRILCAIGYSGVKIDEGKIDIGYSAPGNVTTGRARPLSTASLRVDAPVRSVQAGRGRTASARSSELVVAFRQGKPAEVSFSELTSITSEPEFDLHIDLHAGRSATTFYTSDLTEDYVAFNKGDITDPQSLGG